MRASRRMIPTIRSNILPQNRNTFLALDPMEVTLRPGWIGARGSSLSGLTTGGAGGLAAFGEGWEGGGGGGASGSTSLSRGFGLPAAFSRTAWSKKDQSSSTLLSITRPPCERHAGLG